MTAHRLDLAEPGSFAGARVVCLGTDEDLCRRWCDEGCEEYCSLTHVCDDDPETGCSDPCPREGDEHRWAPLGYCREATWIEAVGIEDCHADPDGFPFDAAGAEQLGVRSGYIEIVWTDDDYVWSYADAPPTDTAVAPAPTADAPALFEVTA